MSSVVSEGVCWYRYENRPHIDDLGIHVVLRTYPVLKETPHGVWLDVWGMRRFVLKDARKRFACPTKEEARTSFLARKKREVRIYETRLTRARLALNVNFDSVDRDTLLFGGFTNV